MLMANWPTPPPPPKHNLPQVPQMRTAFRSTSTTRINKAATALLPTGGSMTKTEVGTSQVPSEVENIHKIRDRTAQLSKGGTTRTWTA